MPPLAGAELPSCAESAFDFAQALPCSVSYVESIRRTARQEAIMGEQGNVQQNNVQLVRQGYDAFKRGDIAGLLQLFADDIEWTLDKVEQIPFSGKRRGKDQVAEFFKLLDENMHALQFEPQQFIAQGDKVVALGHYVWSVKSTDRRIDSDWAHVFTVRDGKISGFREYTDTAASAAAFREPGPEVAI